MSSGWAVLILWLSGDSIPWREAALFFVGFFLLWLSGALVRRFFHGPNGE